MPEYNPQSIRVRDGWAVVLMDERQDVLESGIVLPIETKAEKLTEGGATLVRVGVGPKNQSLGLETGLRVCLRSYLKYANAIPTDALWPSGKPKEYFIMSVDDILAALPPEVAVGVFSRPAMGAVEAVDQDGNVTMKR
jgi:co-chaperonin GroES (HSP10)